MWFSKRTRWPSFVRFLFYFFTCLAYLMYIFLGFCNDFHFDYERDYKQIVFSAFQKKMGGVGETGGGGVVWSFSLSECFWKLFSSKSFRFVSSDSWNDLHFGFCVVYHWTQNYFSPWDFKVRLNLVHVVGNIRKRNKNPNKIMENDSRKLTELL